VAVNGFALAYTVAGGSLVYCGIHGSTPAAFLKALVTGNIGSVPVGLPITWGSTSSSSAGPSDTTATSGDAADNYITIARYLTANGYSNAGAAGVVGCIAGESGGNPEAKQAGGTGVGLIQWSGSNASDITLTGNATADLQSQLPAIISYNNQQGSGLVQMLNALSNPVQAADFYSQNFERPAVTDSDVVPSVATQVFNELQGSTPAPTPSGTQANNLGEL
jgi:hypothetical protein